MARDLPPPTREGALIRRVRESIRPRLSIPAAAEKAGISEVTWGNVERGYKGTGRDTAPIRIVPRAQTLAHMAYALGISPADLQSAGRDDAAAVLTEMVGPELGVVEVPLDDSVMLIPVRMPPGGLSPADVERLRKMAEALAVHLNEAHQDQKD
ncbi:helix-turn-helix domain-containing protein [Sphaerisporangium sp. NPDC049003]|uniref:helix-turn-helix domain-containing protein n=1 Tax=Sphaerisporangium sp. NPDC049003 TaxID=3364517 RepID=UPI0037144ECD